jgi:hypothetical protein
MMGIFHQIRKGGGPLVFREEYLNLPLYFDVLPVVIHARKKFKYNISLLLLIKKMSLQRATGL